MGDFGPAAWDKVANKWHHVSPTLLQKHEDCRRIPYFAKILKLPQEFTRAQKLGDEMHKASEHLVKTGQDLFSDRLRGLRRFYPEQLPNILAHAELGTDGAPKKRGKFRYDLAPKLLSLPLEGYLDLLFLDKSTPVIRDLKTRSKLFTDDKGQGYALTEDQLRVDLQLGLYAWWVTLDEPSDVDVGHLYAQTKGEILTDEVSIILTPADVSAIVARAEEDVRELRELEKVTDPQDIQPTGQAKGYCHKYYGRQCDFLAVCQRTPAARLREHLRAAASFGRNQVGGQPDRSLLSDRPENPRNEIEGSASDKEKGGQVSILDRIRQANQAAAGQMADTTGTQTSQALAQVAAQLPANLGPVQVMMIPSSAQADDPEVKAALPFGGSVSLMPDGSRLLFDKDGNPVKKLRPRKMTITDVPVPAVPAGPSPNQILPPDAPPNDANAVVAPKGKKKATLPQNPPPPEVQGAAPAAAGVPATPVRPDTSGGETKGAVGGAISSSTPGAQRGSASIETNPAQPGTPAEEGRKSPGVGSSSKPGAGETPAGPAKGGAAPGPTPAAGSSAQTGASPGVALPPKLPVKLLVNTFPMQGGFQFLDNYVAARVAKVQELLQVVDFRITDRGAISGRGALAAEVRACPPAPGTYVAMVYGFDSPMQVAVEALVPICVEVYRGAK